MQKLHNRRGKPGFLSPFRSYDYFSLFLRDQTEIVHGQFSLQKKVKNFLFILLGRIVVAPRYCVLTQIALG